MKTMTFLCGGLLVASVAFAGCDPNAVECRPGATQVVIAPDASPVVRFAADEMTNFLAQVLGAPVPIVTEMEVEKRGEGGQRTVNIVLGTNKWSVAAGIHPETLPRDSFIIKVDNSALHLNSTPTPTVIYIAGCDDPTWDIRQAWQNGNTGAASQPFERATVFGVYDFLERYAGCRFYFPGELGTVVPKKASLAVPVGLRSESPDFIKRIWYSPGGKLMEGEDLGTGWKPWDNRRVGFLQFLRSRRFSSAPINHAIRHMSLRERFAKTHPEYFAASLTKDGKVVHTPPTERDRCTHICWSSGVLDEIYKDWVAYYRGEPPESRGIACDPAGGKGVWPRLAYVPGMVGLSPDDGFKACQCDKCRALLSTNGVRTSYASKLVWSKTAEMANRLKRDGIPLLVGQSAYTFYLNIPDDVDIPDNVVVGVVHQGPWKEREPKGRDADLAEIKAWSAKAGGAKVSLHNWALKCSKLKIPDLPCWSPRSIGAYYSRVAPWAMGVYMESSSDRYAHVFLNTYILGKVTWNTKFDYNAAIDEHYELMYGPAAPEMKRFFDDLEECWVGHVTAGKLEYNALGPVQRTPSKFELWRSVYTAEKLKEWEGLFEKAAGKVGVENRCRCRENDNLYARRVELMRRNVLEPVVKARQDFFDETDAAREEARRKREGVHNLLDREYAAEFTCPVGEKPKGNCRRIPFKFETNTTYRLSFFLEADDVRPDSGYAFNGALVAVWSNKGYHFSFGTGAVVGSTQGRVHQAMILKTGPDFEAKEISVWLRGSTGRMKVDGLILEKVEAPAKSARDGRRGQSVGKRANKQIKKGNGR